jgi:hypothetical protein
LGPFDTGVYRGASRQPEVDGTCDDGRTTGVVVDQNPHEADDGSREQDEVDSCYLMNRDRPDAAVRHTLNSTHPKSDATHYDNVRHTAAKYDTLSSTHPSGKCKGNRLQFSEQVIIIEPRGK